MPRSLTGAQYNEPVALPTAPTAHRLNVSTADGTTPPPANDSRWATNPGGYSKCRVFAYVTLSGGTSPAVTLRPWLRSPSGSSTGQVGKGNSINVSGSDQVAFDVQVDGDDLLILVEAISGGPTGVDVDLYISWR